MTAAYTIAAIPSGIVGFGACGAVALANGNIWIAISGRHQIIPIVQNNFDVSWYRHANGRTVRMNTSPVPMPEQVAEGPIGTTPLPGDSNMSLETDGVNVYFTSQEGMILALRADTFMYEVMAGDDTQPPGILDGIGDAARLNRPGSMVYRSGGLIWFLDQSDTNRGQAMIRSINLTTKNVVSRTPKAPAGYTELGAFGWWDAPNPATNRANWFNPDVLPGTGVPPNRGIAWHNGWFYIACSYSGVSTYVGLKRWKPGQPIETIYWDRYPIDEFGIVQRPTGSLDFGSGPITSFAGELWTTGASGSEIGNYKLSRLDIDTLLTDYAKYGQPIRHSWTNPHRYLTDVVNIDNESFQRTARSPNASRDWSWRDGQRPLVYQPGFASLGQSVAYPNRLIFTHFEPSEGFGGAANEGVVVVSALDLTIASVTVDCELVIEGNEFRTFSEQQFIPLPVDRVEVVLGQWMWKIASGARSRLAIAGSGWATATDWATES